MNPFRYRGYIYDEETQMYYLRSRYYYPELQRFISADMRFGGYALFSTNLYLYCLNNPVLYSDSDGCEPQIAPRPSRPQNWNEQFEWNYYFTPAGIYYYGEPNSYRAWQNAKGEWFERWYDSNGLPLKDRHWTDHGNSKEHPWVPHDENWKNNGKGGKTLDRNSARPSPSDAKKPTKSTDSNEISINMSIEASDVGKAVLFLFAVGV